MTAIGWPSSAEELEALQRELALLDPPPWVPDPARPPLVSGVFAASATGLVGAGAVGDPLWAAAVAVGDPLWAAAVVPGPGEPGREVVVQGSAGGPYIPGLLALREGEVLERAVRSLGARLEVLLVNGTGRDHPRRAGIALHLGAVLDVPTVGVTDRALVATAPDPPPERGATAPLALGEEVVGWVLRTRRGARPVCVHAAWRTDPDVALRTVVWVAGRFRTPEPIRLARRLVRERRARDEGRAPTRRGYGS